MTNKEMLSEMRERMFEVFEAYYSNRQQWRGYATTPEDVATDRILSLSTDTCRIAVVRKEGEFPPNPFFGKPPNEDNTYSWYGANSYMELVKRECYVQEVKYATDNISQP